MFEAFKFVMAKPVWSSNNENEQNKTLEFYTNISKEPGSKLFVAGLVSFSVFVNGKFVAFGPARAAHGFYKVDEILLDDFLEETTNKICIRACGYNANSFCYLAGQPFVCAEIICNGNVIAATGYNFEASEVKSKIRKVPRYSFQRTFCEVYDFEKQNLEVKLIETGGGKFLKRDVPYPDYKQIFALKTLISGDINYSGKESYYCPREIKNIGPLLTGFTEKEFEYAPHKEYQKIDFGEARPEILDVYDFEIEKDSYLDVDMGKSQTGLFSFDVEFLEEGTLFVAFGECYFNGEMDWRKDYNNLHLQQNEVDWAKEVLNVIPIKAKKGVYRFVSAEPYVMQYVRFVASSSKLKIKNFSLLEIAFPEEKITYNCEVNDNEIKEIYDAALLSFRANCLDIYMDCPSRERAGWLCDSFFIARTEKLLTGKSVVEKAFLGNFLLPEKFEHIPDGMLPMCYPADFFNGEYISTWAMWYALELYEYFGRTNDYEIIAVAKEKLYKLLKYFKGFENELGLLEKLPGIFIEWSHANHLTEDISFPANMVYAAFKSVLGVLYQDDVLIEEARFLRKTIAKLSLTESGFFGDNAIRQNGKIVLTNERTEACQYYAFFFNVASREEYPDLWQTLVEDFGIDRAKIGKFDEIYPANSFIGNYLRMELLLRYGYTDMLKKSIKEYFLYMARTTGTLWEHNTQRASCNHGFASYVAYWISKLN